MSDRLRFLLDRPLDPLAARAVVVLATAALLGLAAVFVLGTRDPGPAAVPREQGPSAQLRAGRPPARPPVNASPPPQGPPAGRRRQDPQDQRGSSAARNALKELRSHRALQYVPYTHGGVRIALAGVRRGRALLRVSAATPSAARRGWRRFLRHFADTGRAYVPLFTSSGEVDG